MQKQSKTSRSECVGGGGGGGGSRHDLEKHLFAFFFTVWMLSLPLSLTSCFYSFVDYFRLAREFNGIFQCEPSNKWVVDGWTIEFVIE